MYLLVWPGLVYVVSFVRPGLIHLVKFWVGSFVNFSAGSSDLFIFFLSCWVGGLFIFIYSFLFWFNLACGLTDQDPGRFRGLS